MSDTNISFHAESGVRVKTDNIVEKFIFKWDITNFSKLKENVNEVCFSTTSDIFNCKMIRKRNKIHLNILTINEHIIATVLYKSNLLKEDGSTYLEQSGKHIYDLSSNSYDKINKISKCIFEIPGIIEKGALRILPNDVFALPNDVFTLQSVMFFSGHYFTSVDLMLNSKIFQTQKISHDIKDLLQTGEHSDFSLNVGEEKISVHKVILCARSPVFDKMFAHNMIECSQKHVEINDVDINTLNDFVSFLYSGEVENLSWEKAIKLYYVADKYAVEDLQKACSEFFKFHLDIDRVCHILVLADKHGDDALKKSAIKFVRIHLPSVKETNEWCCLVKSNPKLALETLS